MSTLVDLAEWWGGIGLACALLLWVWIKNAPEEPPPAPIYPLDVYRQQKLRAPHNPGRRPSCLRDGNGDPSSETHTPTSARLVSWEAPGGPDGRPAA